MPAKDSDRRTSTISLTLTQSLFIAIVQAAFIVGAVYVSITGQIEANARHAEDAGVHINSDLVDHQLRELTRNVAELREAVERGNSSRGNGA